MESIGKSNVVHEHFTPQLSWTTLSTSSPKVRSVRIIAQRYPAIFSDAVGVLTLNELDIVNARSYHDGEKMLCRFDVRCLPGPAPGNERLEQAKKRLMSYINQSCVLTLVLKQKLAQRRCLPSQTPIEVEIDNESSTLYSLIKVKADDFPGVLFIISDALYASDLTIWKANIATANGRIDDIFYVRDAGGGKLTSDAHSSAVRAKLFNAYNLMNGRN